MPNPVLYHNPRCSKSRQALAMLKSKNINCKVVEYLKTPLSDNETTSIYKALIANSAIKNGHDMIRNKESEFALAGLSKSASDSDIIAAIVKYPKLLERPIYMNNHLAAIGRPIENIEALIND